MSEMTDTKQAKLISDFDGQINDFNFEIKAIERPGIYRDNEFAEIRFGTLQIVVDETNENSKFFKKIFRSEETKSLNIKICYKNKNDIIEKILYVAEPLNLELNKLEKNVSKTSALILQFNVLDEQI